MPLAGKGAAAALGAPRRGFTCKAADSGSCAQAAQAALAAFGQIDIQGKP